MKKVCYILFLFGCLFINSLCYANDIKSIDMSIYVDNYGDAHVTETWVASLTSGTEGYKPYYNLGESKITDYSVKMNGLKFTTTSSWDIDASFSSKSYKAGIHSISNGYELCFGITKYGTNTYVMNYTITNFVMELDDADMIYWQLIPYELSDKPENVHIKVYSDFDYNDNWDVWGYGYGSKSNEGYAYIADGYIEMSKDGALNSNEYMVLLAKFPKGTFNTRKSLNHNFNYYYEMAEEGATTYHKKGIFSTILSIIGAIFLGILNFFPYIIFILILFFASQNSSFGTKKVKFNTNVKKLLKKDNVPYFRDIPCDKNLFKAYWVAGQYELIKNKTDVLGTLLLKWLKNGNIENVTVTSKVMKKEERAVKLVTANGLTENEKSIYYMMLNASVDNVLEKNEFESWCKKNYSKILNWFNTIIDAETMNFVEEGLIEENKKTFGKEYVVKELMHEKAIQMAGLKYFLLDFSNIKDRESIEVKLWEEYLMYAQIFGIAEKVAQEFKRLYPDVITDEYYDDFIFIHTISYNGVHAASLAKSRAESYSSGGGGFSSSGGGGGSFGGGGGGGGFR